MKIVNKRPEKTADISSARNSASEELIKLVISAVLFIVILFFLIGFAVDLIVPRISIETECRLFRFNDQEKPAASGTENTDPALKTASEILKKFKSDPDVPDIDFRLIRIMEKKPNAFAIPGGTIGLTSGLLETLDKEIELAFVIAHEIGHFRNRDHLRGLGRAAGFSVIMAVLFQSGPGIESFAGIVSYTAQRHYSREREEKADRYAVKLVHSIYGKTEGTERLFRILTEEHNIPEWAYMFSTHPSPEKRIEYMKEYSEKL